MSATDETSAGIRRFHIDTPEEALDDLRRRIAATQWPQNEAVADESRPSSSVTLASPEFEGSSRMEGAASLPVGRPGSP